MLGGVIGRHTRALEQWEGGGSPEQLEGPNQILEPIPLCVSLQHSWQEVDEKKLAALQRKPQ